MNLKALIYNLLLSLILTAPVKAAVQGRQDIDSTGTLNVSLSIGKLGLIRGLSDIDLGVWKGTGDLDGNDDVCVYTFALGVGSASSYRIRADGDGLNNKFNLDSGTNTMGYRAFWNNQQGTTGNTELTAGINSVEFPNSSVPFNCNSPNANIEVLINEATMSTIPDGVYSGILTLTLIPK